MKSGERVQNPVGTSFAKWVIIFIAVYSALEAVFAGVAGIILGLAFRQLLLPYALLLIPPLVMAPLTFWARQSYNHPNTFAFRFALSICLGLLMFMLVLAFDLDKVGVLSRTYLRQNYLPYVVPVSLLAAIMIYRAMRRSCRGAEPAGERPSSIKRRGSPPLNYLTVGCPVFRVLCERREPLTCVSGESST